MRCSRINYAAAVARWAPDARERLESAALDLFVENGYEQTTVTQIAERAGLNRATFFRHFTDKQEVLFGGEDTLTALFADAIRTADSHATLNECLQLALTAAKAVLTAQQRRKATQRIAVAAATPEVHERALLKHARIASAVAAALGERGTDQLSARLASEVCVLAFRVAFERWMKAADGEPFPPFAVEALNDVTSRAANLQTHAPSSG
jgi:AcrR family transcriptional regulator